MKCYWSATGVQLECNWSAHRLPPTATDCHRLPLTGLRCSPQGTLTAKEVNHILKMKGLEHEFPFFTTVYKISYEDTPLSAITETPY